MLQRILPITLYSLLALYASAYSSNQPEPSPSPIRQISIVNPSDKNIVQQEGRSSLNSPYPIDRLTDDELEDMQKQNGKAEELTPVHKVVSTSQEATGRLHNNVDNNQRDNLQQLGYWKTLGYVGGSICLAATPVIIIYFAITQA